MSTDSLDATARSYLVDLRTEYDDLVRYETFNGYVRDREEGRVGPAIDHWGAPVRGGGRPRKINLEQVVVIDRITDMDAHEDAFAQILKSRSVSRTVCVLIGDGRHGDRYGAFAVPPMLANERVAVLWVGSEVGILWDPDEGPSRDVMIGDKQYFDTLLAALSVPEIFDELLAKAKKLPGTVASPGVRATANTLEEELLDRVEREVIGVLAPKANGVEPDTASGTFLDRTTLLARLGQITVPRPHGALGDAEQDAHRQVAYLHTLVTEAQHAAGVVRAPRRGNLVRAFRSAGDALTRYRDALAEAFQRGDTPPDEERRGRLRQLGLVLPQAPQRHPLVDDIRESSQAVLEQGHSLTALIARLRRLATGVLPTGGAARVGNLHSAYPATAADTLASTVPMPGGFGGISVPLLMMLAGLLAGLCVTPGWIGAGAVTVGVVAVATLVRSARARFGLLAATPGADALVVALSAVLAGGAGAGGFVLQQLDEFPALPGGGVAALLALVVLIVLVLPFWWWWLLVRQWTPTLPLAIADRSLAALGAEFDDTVIEWVLTDTRRHASDVLRLTAAAFDEVRTALVDHAAALRRSVPAPAGRTASAAALGARDVIRHDLISLTLDGLSASWAHIDEADRHGSVDGARTRSSALLSEYDLHLRRFGLEQPPPNWLHRPEPRPFAGRWWREPSQLAEALDPHSEVQQLCDDAQAAALRQEYGDIVRFAPRAANELALQGATGADSSLRDVVWTTSGGLAGVLTLVPLRAGSRPDPAGTSERGF